MSWLFFRPGAPIDKARLLTEARRRASEAAELRALGLEVAARVEPEEVIASVIDRTRGLLDSACVGLALIDKPAQELVIRMRSDRAHGITCHRMAMASGTAPARVVASGRADEHTCHIYARQRLACVSVPLRVGEETIGSLCEGRSRDRGGTCNRTDLLSQVADLAAISLTNANRYQETRRHLHELEALQHLAVLEERDRIAREMHDSLAQVLSLLILKSRSARGLLAAGAIEQTATELESITQVADDAYADVREAILGLRESISPETGLVGTLREHLEKYSRQSGIVSQLVVPGEREPRCAPEAEVQVLRMVQEALTNVRKHAGASEAIVRLEVEKGFVRVAVEDNGRGFMAEPRAGGEGFGLHTMRERIESVGGSFEIVSVPGEGTRVVATLPREGGDGDGANPRPTG